MKRPCDSCPFLKKNAGMLHPSRSAQIAASLENDNDFPCHKTVDYSSDFAGKVTVDSKRCFGAALYLENIRLGARGNLAFRLAVMFGEFEVGDLRLDDTVFQSQDEFTGVD